MPELNTTASHRVNTWASAFACGWDTPGMHETTARLLQAAAEVGKLTMPSKVAIALGESQQTLKHWEKRGMSKSGQLKACELWGLSPAWLREGVGPPSAGFFPSRC